MKVLGENIRLQKSDERAYIAGRIPINGHLYLKMWCGDHIRPSLPGSVIAVHHPPSDRVVRAGLANKDRPRWIISMASNALPQCGVGSADPTGDPHVHGVILTAVQTLCLISSLSASSCASTNTTCLCLDQTYSNVVTDCVLGHCTIRESLSELHTSYKSTLCFLQIQNHKMTFANTFHLDPSCSELHSNNVPYSDGRSLVEYLATADHLHHHTGCNFLPEDIFEDKETIAMGPGRYHDCDGVGESKSRSTWPSRGAAGWWWLRY